MTYQLNKKWGIVVSDFNTQITQSLKQGALSRLKALKIPEEKIECVHVPGAIELPLAAKRLAKTEKYHAIILLGAVIQGETDHYTYVCQQVSYGCQQVMLEFELPIIFGVLTTQTEQQAQERAGGKEGNKGEEAAEAAVVMAKFMMNWVE